MPDNLLPPPNDPQKILSWVDRTWKDFDNRLGFVEKFFRDTNGHSIPGRMKNLERGVEEIKASQKAAAETAARKAEQETATANERKVRHWHLAVTVLAAILGNQGASQILKPASTAAAPSVSAPAPALDVEALKQSIVKALIDNEPAQPATTSRRVRAPRKPKVLGLQDATGVVPLNSVPVMERTSH